MLFDMVYVPDEVWAKRCGSAAQQKRWEKNFWEAHKAGKPYCIVCGRGLNEPKAKMILSLDDAQMVPVAQHEVALANEDKRPWLKWLAFGPECQRLIPAEFRVAYDPAVQVGGYVEN